MNIMCDYLDYYEMFEVYFNEKKCFFFELFGENGIVVIDVDVLGVGWVIEVCEVWYINVMMIGCKG